MTEKSATTKQKAAPAKSPAATRKSAMVKPVAAKPASVKTTAAAKREKKNKKAKKTDGKAENKIKKVVRDSFTMPQNDYAKIGELKQVCLKAGIHAKKSELLRAGLHALCKLNASQLKQAVMQMEQIKTGRPKKS